MNYLSEVRTVFRHAIRLQPGRLSVANYSKVAEPKDDEIYDEDKEGENVSDHLVDEVDVEAREKEIERMRNKSRLNKTHRNFLFDLPKPNEEYKWDKTLYFSRKQFGRYGSKTGIDPRLCFYTPEEIADRAEFQRVLHPYTIQQMVEMSKKAKAEKQAVILEREKKIAQNLTKLDRWMEDLHKRVAQKEEEARQAKAKREALLEDIRQEFGFKIDYKDPRFKALMEKKELEAKKAKKAEKKKKREEQLMQKLKEQAQETMEKGKDAKKAEKSDDKSKDAKKEKEKDDSGSSSDSDSDSDDEKDKQKK
ncbi:growth arrest and DNA damage-inducible proteins-interacting protein 1 [Sitodiplosis mosellana]|uniref:growth arrest and DNA damage-inducible proteins-interacting protein 1 n=1 Tax=Sitodiplosis mosellana TaxID=263140 RepID=UPI002444D285|nr:growth arrest and DNA damage-inducible proteins-interacting protein 1 [Sitodiplosis mosellana]